MEIPTELQDSFTQEAVFQAVTERLESSRSEIEAQLKELRSGLVLNPRKRAEIKEQASELKDILTTLEKAKMRAEEVREGLHADLNTQFDRYLRQCSPEYVKGIQARTHLKDFVQCLEQFRSNVQALRRAMGETRGAMTAGYDNENRQHSENAIRMLQAAIGKARIVEEDIRFLNQLRASHDSTIENTRHEEVEIPEMPDLPYSTWLEYAPNFDIPTLQSEFDARLAELDALDDSGIDDIAVKTREAIDSHQDLGKSLLNELWLAVNHYAREHWVEESSLEEEIERLESNYGRTDVAL